ncbi:octanoyltransferase, mitochondrial [Trichomonascus vanleenenianus]|uniref:lipoyl(octanoyl) transferase LIP2 n=1 Tax=Trichomonascus vanleenenianus TaxID=2268995 RepID=UPI003EC9F045
MLASKPSTLNYVPPQGLTSYGAAGETQEALVKANLDWKLKKREDPVAPTLLAFEMNPVYTCGRRERGHMTSEEIKHFEADGKAQFVETYRGGQTTFHGPGQLVCYPIIDLRAFGISPRCYVNLLEDTIIDTLSVYGVKGMRTEDTGVWVDETNKIAAIGIHVRRNITSHGIALNVSTDTWWFDRIIACGLPDKKTTTMRQQNPALHKVTVAQVSDTFASVLADKLHCNLVSQ